MNTTRASTEPPRTYHPLLPVMMASTFSGAAARIPLHPIDTVKAKLQTMSSVMTNSGGQRVSAWQVFLSTYRNEGVRGLFSGLGVALLGSAPAGTLYFTSYEFSKTQLGQLAWFEKRADAANFCSGLIAEAMSCVLWVPIDVTKERLQTQAALDPNLRYRGNIDALRTIVKQEGLRGLYRGYGATLMSFGPFSAFYLMFYEQLKSSAQLFVASSPSSSSSCSSSTSTLSLPNPTSSSTSSSTLTAPTLHTGWFMLCGAVAGGASAILTNPLDIAKLRLQVQRNPQQQQQAANNGAQSSLAFGYRNMFDGMTKIVRHEGWRALFKGVGARVMFHSPTTALNIACYEECKLFFSALFPPHETK